MTSLRRTFLSRHSRIVPRSCIGVNYSKGLTRRPPDDEKEGKENSSHYLPCVIIIFPRTAERDETPVLIIIIRIKAFTVFGLMFIRFAISLPLRPCSKYSNASPSRCVRLNCWETCDKGMSPEGPRSSRTAMQG